MVDPLLSAVCELKIKLDEHKGMRVKLVTILEELESNQLQLYLDNCSHSAGLNMDKLRLKEVEELVQSNANPIISLSSSGSGKIDNLRSMIPTLEDGGEFEIIGIL